MSALDIQPPGVPGEKIEKKGFFSRIFRKKDVDTTTSNMHEDEFDLEDIRRKLGLDESESQSQPSKSESPSPENSHTEDSTLMNESRDSDEQVVSSEPEKGEQPATLEQPATDDALPPIPGVESPTDGVEGGLEQVADVDVESTDKSVVSEVPTPWDQSPTVSDTSSQSDSQSQSQSQSQSGSQPEPASSWTKSSHVLDESSNDDDGESSKSEWTSDSGNVVEERVETVSEDNKEENKEENKEPSVDGEGGEWSDEEDSKKSIETSTKADDELKISEPESFTSEEIAPLTDKHFEAFNSDREKVSDEVRELPVFKVQDHKDNYEQLVPEGKEFILKNGKPLKSLRELQEALEVIDEETFLHHVNEEKNDFATWILHVCKEDELSRKIAEKVAKKELVKLLKNHHKKIKKDLRNIEKGKKQEENLKRAKELEQELVEMKEALVKKSTELEQEQEFVKKKMSKQIVSELNKRLKKEREELRKEIASAKAEVKPLKNELKKEKARYERERASLEKRRESLSKIEHTIHEEEKHLQQERSEAEDLIKQGKEVVKQIEQLDREKEELKQEKETLTKEKEELRSLRASLNGKQASLSKKENRLVAKQETLEKQKEDFSHLETKLREEMDYFEKRQADWLEKERALTKKEKETMARLERAERQAKDREEKAKTAENKLEEKLKERRKITRYIEEAERHLSENKHLLGGEELEGGLKKRRSSIPSHTVPHPGSIRNLKIYETIDRARQAIADKKFKEARKLYNSVREAFNKEQLSTQEKSVLYTIIRELYDDISLAELE